MQAETSYITTEKNYNKKTKTKSKSAKELLEVCRTTTLEILINKSRALDQQELPQQFDPRTPKDTQELSALTLPGTKGMVASALVRSASS